MNKVYNEHEATGNEPPYDDDKVTEDRYKRYKKAMEDGDMATVAESCLAICEPYRVFEKKENVSTCCSLRIKNSLVKWQIIDLGDGKAAFGAIVEDRHWVQECILGNGIEWYWRCVGVLLDVEHGKVIAAAKTDRTCVRDATDPKKDKWNNISDKIISKNDYNITFGLKADDSGKYYEKACIFDYWPKIFQYNSQRENISKLKEVKEKVRKDIPQSRAQAPAQDKPGKISVLDRVAKNGRNSRI